MRFRLLKLSRRVIRRHVGSRLGVLHPGWRRIALLDAAFQVIFVARTRRREQIRVRIGWIGIAAGGLCWASGGPNKPPARPASPVPIFFRVLLYPSFVSPPAVLHRAFF